MEVGTYFEQFISYISSLAVVFKKETVFILRIFLGLKQIIEGCWGVWFCLQEYCSRRRMIKFTYVIKNRSIKTILFREVMHSNNKILLEKVAKNRKSIVVFICWFSFDSSLLRFNFQIVSISGFFLPKQSSLLL